ncbi:hypothetical protein QOT17_007690 [Balamuthia mandrillaris]
MYPTWFSRGINYRFPFGRWFGGRGRPSAFLLLVLLFVGAFVLLGLISQAVPPPGGPDGPPSPLAFLSVGEKEAAANEGKGEQTTQQKLYNLHKRLLEYIKNSPSFDDRRMKGRGIVISGGGQSYLPFLYSLLNHIRQEIKCDLPIEIWTLRSENSIECNDLLESNFSNVTVKVIEDVTYPVSAKALVPLMSKVKRLYFLKVFSLISSSFREVLVLDADCVPMEDPVNLFESPSFVQHGNMFWTDTPPPFSKSAFFEGTGFKRTWKLETDSGQIFLDKKRTWKGLMGAWFLNQEAPLVYRFVLGDKDTFPLGFDAAGIHFNQILSPRSGWGGYFGNPNVPHFFFTSFVHFNPDTRAPAFFHHVSARVKKRIRYLTARPRPLWESVLDYTALGFTRAQIKQNPPILLTEAEARDPKLALRMSGWIVEASLRYQQVFRQFEQSSCYQSSKPSALTASRQPSRWRKVGLLKKKPAAQLQATAQQEEEEQEDE